MPQNIKARKYKDIKLDPVDHLYERIKFAETGTVNQGLLDSDGEYWRRTLAPENPVGSTAFGPVQLTSSLIAGAAVKKGYDFDDEERKYALGFFVPQGKLFALHGTNTAADPDAEQNRPDFHNPAFDYAGYGDGRGYLGDKQLLGEWGGEDKIKEMYRRIAKKILKYSLDKHGGDFSKAMIEWRGKTPKQDYAYFERAMRAPV